MTIQSVSITNLYGNDYKWQLKPDVNILIGANGTYKSTILALIRGIKSKDKETTVKIIKQEDSTIRSVPSIDFNYGLTFENKRGTEFIKRIIPNYKGVLVRHSDGVQQLANILYIASSANKQLVLFLDNPENNLHIDWQEKLIDWIRELNPTCQIIMTTHSPDIVSHYNDKVFSIKDIKVN